MNPTVDHPRWSQATERRIEPSEPETNIMWEEAQQIVQLCEQHCGPDDADAQIHSGGNASWLYVLSQHTTNQYRIDDGSWMGILRSDPALQLEVMPLDVVTKARMEVLLAATSLNHDERNCAHRSGGRCDLTFRTFAAYRSISPRSIRNAARLRNRSGLTRRMCDTVMLSRAA